jgi:hypothetical protein
MNSLNTTTSYFPNEYVALLLSEEQMDGDEYTPSVYVYAIIIRKCETTDCESNVLRNTLQMYEVKVGRFVLHSKVKLHIR